jgi:rubrerythrin
MAELHHIDEVLEFAIGREVESYELYTYLSQRIENPAMCRICEKFAAMELGHKARLELELIKVGRVVSGSEQPIFNISDYTDKEAENPIDLNYKELLVFAIKKEETSIRLYNDLANVVHDKESREVLLELAEEENQHRLRFEIEYNNIKNK